MQPKKGQEKYVHHGFFKSAQKSAFGAPNSKQCHESTDWLFELKNNITNDKLGALNTNVNKEEVEKLKKYNRIVKLEQKALAAFADKKTKRLYDLQNNP